MSDENWHQLETYRSLMLYGNNAVRFVLIANGGAVISLLTFLGHFLENSETSIDMAWPMGCFLLGIVIGGISNVTAYLTQLALFNEGNDNSLKISHRTWLKLTISFILVGIVLFGGGAILALHELRSYS